MKTHMALEVNLFMLLHRLITLITTLITHISPSKNPTYNLQ